MILKLWDWMSLNIISKIKWDFMYFLFYGRRYGLNMDQHLKIFYALKKERAIIITWRSTHLTSYLIAISHFLLTGKWTRASHAVLGPISTNDMDFVEAVGKGVVRSGFYEVFNVERAVLLRPKHSKDFDWDKAMKEALNNIGKEYDTRFKWKDEEKMSCVEVVLDSLNEDPEFNEEFKELVDMMKKEKNLTPAMFLECGAFEVILEVNTNKGKEVQVC